MSEDPLTLSWASVVLFYAARDIVHAVLDASSTLPAAHKHPESHTNQDLKRPGTNVLVKRFYPRISVPYMDLYAVSTGVRYEGSTIDDWPGLLADFDDIRRCAVAELVQADRDVPDWLRRSIPRSTET